MVVGFSNEPTVFNPLLLGLSVDQGVWWNLFDPLWGVDPAGRLYPMLATEIPTQENGGLSADGRTWRIRLRKGVKWHDGRPFTAHDVKFTIELLKNPAFRAPSRAGHELVRDIRVVNDHELIWRLAEPFAPFISMLSWTFIVPAHGVDKVADPNTAPFNSAPIGTGPFKWGNRRAGDQVLLVANTDYFGEGPYLERLVFKYVPDMTSLYTQFRTGQIDYLGLQGITSDNYAEAKTLPGLKIHLVEAVGIENVSLNLGHPALAEKAVRHALYHGMDKKSIIDALYFGLPKPAESYLPSQNWAFNPGLPKHEYSVAKANQMLELAGWKKGSDGVRVKNGVKLQFANSTASGNRIREQTQQLLVQDWAKIGVSLSINNMPGAVLFGKFWSHSQFDTMLTYTDCTVASDPNVLHRFGSTAIAAKGGTGSNIYQYQNPTVDKLLKNALESNSREQRKADYMQVQKVMRDELVMLPIFQLMQIEGTKANLMGFTANVNVRSIAWSAARWYWA